MNTRAIGSLQVSVIGLGCNNFGQRLDAQGTARVVHAALDAGITFFDTADKYGGTQSEVMLGMALKQHRAEAVIATKFGLALDEQHKGAHPDYVPIALEASLRRLGTDYIDLYQLHRPDPSVPIGATLAALAAQVRAGKIREIGCSNFSAAQLREAEAAATAGACRFVSVQNEYSLLERAARQDVLPLAQALGMAFLPYFPLASGLLTGKYLPGEPLPAGTRLSGQPIDPDQLALVGRLHDYTRSHQRSLLELAIAWLLAQAPVASVIAGATSPEQVKANAGAAGWQLNPAMLAEVDALLGEQV